MKVEKRNLNEALRVLVRQNGEPVNISLVKWNLRDIVNMTHVVLIIGQNKMCAKFRTLPNVFSVYSMHQIVMPEYENPLYPTCFVELCKLKNIK